MADVKAGGKGAVLSGKAAAHLLGLMRGKAPAAEITAPNDRRTKGLESRRITLPNNERTTFNRIPCTTPARTLLDLAATLDPPLPSRVVHEAQVRFRVTPQQVGNLLARHSNAPGSKHLRRIIRGDDPVVLSHMEEAFIKLPEQHKLPLPETNEDTDGHYVDCRWPDRKLTVELDSYRFHNSRHSWEQDRKREREAYQRGDQFRRYTYADVCEDPARMLAEVRAVLA